VEPGSLEVSDNAIRMLIRQYAVEAGLWALQRELETLTRKYARQRVASGPCQWKVTEKNLSKILGAPIYIPDMAEAKPEVGVATGLAWTETGGDIMLIEALKMKGSGTVISTGSLGDVMKESIQASHSYVRAKADLLGIRYEDFTSHDIHIHFPSGAVPKDGPSAGIAISLAIASVMANKAIRNDLAMTGEVSLRGKVLPVGGIREKVSAALRVGIRTVVLPKQNEKDLEDLPPRLRKEMKFIPIEYTEEIFPLAFVDYQPGLASLEQLLRQEVEKVRKKKTKENARERKAAKSARSRKPHPPEEPTGSINFV
jgi:ATP-dependent Lon protease